MNKHLTRFRGSLHERVQNLLWAQWDSVGVAGHAVWNRSFVIDPDALLVFSCSLARHDARLFDEILDWMAVNGRFLNVQRITNIVRKTGLQGGSVLSAVADFMAQGGVSAKWGRLACLFQREGTKAESLFFLEDGKPMPDFGPSDSIFLEHGFWRGTIRLRGHSRPFPPARPANLWLALRALLGVNTRCEILLYLLLNGKGHARGIARETFFSQKTIQDAISEMGQSGFVQGQDKGCERVYSIQPEAWMPQADPSRWLNWPAVFSALESIWTVAMDPKMELRDDLMLAADLNGLVRSIAPMLTHAGVTHHLEARPVENEEEYIQATLRELFSFIEGIS